MPDNDCCQPHIVTADGPPVQSQINPHDADHDNPDVEDEGDFADIDEATLQTVLIIFSTIFTDISLETQDDLPPDFKIDSMWRSMVYNPVVTDFHQEANEVVDKLKDSMERTESFNKKPLHIINGKIKCIGRAYQQKELTQIYSSSNAHQTRALFDHQCKNVFNADILTKAQTTSATEYSVSFDSMP